MLAPSGLVRSVRPSMAPAAQGFNARQNFYVKNALVAPYCCGALRKGGQADRKRLYGAKERYRRRISRISRRCSGRPRCNWGTTTAWHLYRALWLSGCLARLVWGLEWPAACIVLHSAVPAPAKCQGQQRPWAGFLLLWYITFLYPGFTITGCRCISS